MERKISLYISFVMMLFSACNGNRIVYYEYKNVIVTRIDEGTESHFYYGKYENDQNLPASFVKSTFSGFNSGMDAYLIFKSDRVEVYYIMEYFENIGITNKIRVINNPTSSTFSYNFEDKIKGKYDSICRISDILSREKEFNLENNSRVKATYLTGETP